MYSVINQIARLVFTRKMVFPLVNNLVLVTVGKLSQLTVFDWAGCLAIWVNFPTLFGTDPCKP